MKPHQKWTFPVNLHGNPLVCLVLWIDVLPVRAVITCLGHLENPGSLSYVDIPHVDSSHGTVSKNHFYKYHNWSHSKDPLSIGKLWNSWRQTSLPKLYFYLKSLTFGTSSSLMPWVLMKTGTAFWGLLVPCSLFTEWEQWCFCRSPTRLIGPLLGRVRDFNYPRQPSKRW